MRTTPVAAALIATMTLSSSVFAQPVEVVSGQDLADWQSVEKRRLQGEEAIAAYRSFIVAFPTSPLAEAAWGRLVDMGANDHAWADEAGIRPHFQDVELSWSQHQQVLDRAVPVVAVAELSVVDADVASAERWNCARLPWLPAVRSSSWSPWRSGPVRCR